jgi:hypothetical protein
MKLPCPLAALVFAIISFRGSQLPSSSSSSSSKSSSSEWSSSSSSSEVSSSSHCPPWMISSSPSELCSADESSWLSVIGCGLRSTRQRQLLAKAYCDVLWKNRSRVSRYTHVITNVHQIDGCGRYSCAVVKDWRVVEPLLLIAVNNTRSLLVQTLGCTRTPVSRGTRDVADPHELRAVCKQSRRFET